MEITASEVAEVLRRGLAGAVVVRLVSDIYWFDVGSGNVEFTFGDWQITFFNDAGELDYVDRVIAPDGRAANYDDWCRPIGNGLDPIDLLATWEQCELSRLLERLSPSV